MYKRLLELLKINKPHLQQSNIISSVVYVTMDWSGNPITTKGDGYILPRRAEMILNKQYYPTGTIGEWPCDPISGEKLPIEPIT
jgi:hypothetical protein